MFTDPFEAQLVGAYRNSHVSSHVNSKYYVITFILENVEHCGGEPEQADTGILCQ